MKSRVFADTNIVVYAHISNEAEKHEIAKALLSDNLAGSRLWISTQILSEFYSAMNKNFHSRLTPVFWFKRKKPQLSGGISLWIIAVFVFIQMVSAVVGPPRAYLPKGLSSLPRSLVT